MRKDKASLGDLADCLDRLGWRLGLEGEPFGAVLERSLNALAVGKGRQQAHAHRVIAPAYLRQRVQTADGNLHVDNRHVDVRVMAFPICEPFIAILDGLHHSHVRLSISARSPSVTRA